MLHTSAFLHRLSHVCFGLCSLGPAARDCGVVEHECEAATVSGDAGANTRLCMIGQFYCTYRLVRQSQHTGSFIEYSQMNVTNELSKILDTLDKSVDHVTKCSGGTPNNLLNRSNTGIWELLDSMSQRKVLNHWNHCSYFCNR